MGCGASKPKTIDRVLDVCVRSNDAEAVTVALERVGVALDIDATDEHGMTALMYASVLGKQESVATLIARGASTDVVDRNGMTAAMHAAYVGQDAALRALESGGANLSPGCKRTRKAF
jgi:ankyrin repeat protein